MPILHNTKHTHTQHTHRKADFGGWRDANLNDLVQFVGEIVMRRRGACDRDIIARPMVNRNTQPVPLCFVHYVTNLAHERVPFNMHQSPSICLLCDNIVSARYTTYPTCTMAADVRHTGRLSPSPYRSMNQNCKAWVRPLISVMSHRNRDKRRALTCNRYCRPHWRWRHREHGKDEPETDRRVQ